MLAGELSIGLPGFESTAMEHAAAFEASEIDYEDEFDFNSRMAKAPAESETGNGSASHAS